MSGTSEELLYSCPLAATAAKSRLFRSLRCTRSALACIINRECCDADKWQGMNSGDRCAAGLIQRQITGNVTSSMTEVELARCDFQRAVRHSMTPLRIQSRPRAANSRRRGTEK